MVVSIKHTLELMAVILSDGFPLICGNSLQFKGISQHRIVQDNIGIQLIILALGQFAIGIGQLGQIAQLGTIIDYVGI